MLQQITDFTVFYHRWGSSLCCILHSHFGYLLNGLLVTAIQSEKTCCGCVCGINRKFVSGDLECTVLRQAVGPQQQPNGSLRQSNIMARSKADASVWSQMKHRVAILRPKQGWGMKLDSVHGTGTTWQQLWLADLNEAQAHNDFTVGCDLETQWKVEICRSLTFCMAALTAWHAAI